MSKPTSFLAQMEFTRRQALAMAGMAALVPAFPARADVEIGKLVDAKGNVMKTRDAVETALTPGAALSNNDLVATGKSFASMSLGSDTRIMMGENTEVLLDSFLAEQGGIIELVSGDMVFDRPEGMPKIDLTIRTTFGQIGVRGTKFFTGKSRGNFAVFVEHGLVEIKSGQSIRKIGPGEGVDIATDARTRSLFGGDLSETKKWGKGRIEEAYKAVRPALSENLKRQK